MYMHVQPQSDTPPLVVHVPPALPLTRATFRELCQANRDLRIERTAQGDLIIMPPAGGGTSRRNANLTFQLSLWSHAEGSGVVFDSSGGFELPNGATRSPDAAWVRHERLAALEPDDKEAFLPLCPDFVVEIRSPTDRITSLRHKMDEYMANGGELGWLIDPIERRVYVYRRGQTAECLDNPVSISAGTTLPGFVLDLAPIWDVGF
jgi:Uma2 family endonuclease